MAEVWSNAFGATRMVAAKLNFILERKRQIYIDDGLDLFVLELFVLERREIMHCNLELIVLARI